MLVLINQGRTVYKQISHLIKLEYVLKARSGEEGDGENVDLYVQLWAGDTTCNNLFAISFIFC